jgi:DNA-binding NarL/FixJ family response regulator
VAEVEALIRGGRLRSDGSATAVQAGSAPAEDDADSFGLTPREREVLRLVAVSADVEDGP